jgi:hypothetical protein
MESGPTTQTVTKVRGQILNLSMVTGGKKIGIFDVLIFWSQDLFPFGKAGRVEPILHDNLALPTNVTVTKCL